ncbi:MAG: hypothetical protein WC227_00450 [Patescibacteria group bacterium]|jgi:hypothetical protein
MPDEEEIKVEVKQIVDNKTGVSINSGPHLIKEIQKEIAVIEESTTPAKQALAENEEFWEEK